MHEVSIVESLIEQVEREVAQSGHQGRVLHLELIVGRLCGASADAIRFAFELLAPETFLKDAELTIHEPRAVCCCAACGGRSEIDELVSVCPQCGSSRITFEGGQDLLLESIDLED